MKSVENENGEDGSLYVQTLSNFLSISRNGGSFEMFFRIMLDYRFDEFFYQDTIHLSLKRGAFSLDFCKLWKIHINDDFI